MKFNFIFCIDGSGNKNIQDADKKRPIYKLDVFAGTIARVNLARDQSASDYFSKLVTSLPADSSIMIAADVPIGLPIDPNDVYQENKATTFLDWLAITQSRLSSMGVDWRNELIAVNSTQRTPQKPFVSIKGGDEIGKWAGKRKCDLLSRGESLYCVDHSAKQVGKAALQFWFEVLIPLQIEFTTSLAVWPFQEIDDKRVVIAECYPAECQRMVFGTTKHKRNATAVSSSLIGLAADPGSSHGVSLATWIQAASSEDEFDMFTTAYAIRQLLQKNINILNHPNDLQCTQFEGWMIGLKENELETSRASSVKQNPVKRVSSVGKSSVPIGSKNRNEQEHLGLSGANGPKGPMHLLKCHRINVSAGLCGYEHETNPQDVFHKKCPKCQC